MLVLYRKISGIRLIYFKQKKNETIFIPPI